MKMTRDIGGASRSPLSDIGKWNYFSVVVTETSTVPKTGNGKITIRKIQSIYILYFSLWNVGVIGDIWELIQLNLMTN